MAQSVGAVALDIVMGKNTVSSAVKGAMNDVQNTASSGGSKISKALSGVGKAAATVGKATMVGLGAAATGIAVIGKQAIGEYANYEQLVGGVETLFKSSSNKVINYANDAYKTAGLSANAYMETVTGFSASLLQSLGGDTQKAADTANMAVVDMSDNANKMGTSMEMIQNAYQGFAKQNYTMLDNLKLGYGGTKEEMQRLLDDAEKLTGTKFDISNFADITNAIHAIQTEMGITGTTAKEAGTTIEGSIGMMKSAWTNLLTGMTDENQNLGQLVDNFASSVGTVAENLIPRLTQVLSGFATVIGRLAPQLSAMLPGIFEQLLPALVTGATSLIQSLVVVAPDILQTLLGMVPELISSVQTIVQELCLALPQIIQVLVQALPVILPALIEGIAGIITSVAEMLPQIIEPIIQSLPDIINSVVNALIENAPALIQGCVLLVTQLVASLPEIIMGLLDAIPEIFTNLLGAINENAPALFDGIKATVSGALDNIRQTVSNVFNSVSNFVSRVWAGIKTSIHNILTSIRNTVSNIFTAIKNKVSNIVTAIRNKIVNVFTAVKNTVSNIFTAIKNKIHNILTNIKNTVSNIFTNIKNTVSNIVTNIKNKAVNAFGNMVTGIKNKVSRIYTTVKDGFANAIKFITGLPKRALEWGKDMIQGLINGIKSMIGKVGDAVKSVADKITGFLHFSVPDEGPLTDYESWMPDFIDGMAKGIDKNKYRLINSVKSMASEMRVTGTIGDMTMQAPALKNVGANAQQTQTTQTGDEKLYGLLAQLLTKLDNTGNITIPVYLGNDLIDELIIKAGDRRTIRSGGRA